MTSIHRIYCENVKTENGESLPVILAVNCLDSFNVQETGGYWKGIKEQSLVIECIGDKTVGNSMKHLAERIRRHCEQEAVILVTLPVIDFNVVTADS
jgi:hypothetical protein